MVGNILHDTKFILISIFQFILIKVAWTGWDGTVQAGRTKADVNAIDGLPYD
jgi:hypothetical protein